MTATIESSWILIWLPTKKRENSQRKSSMFSGGRKITRIFSVDEEQNGSSKNKRIKKQIKKMKKTQKDTKVSIKANIIPREGNNNTIEKIEDSIKNPSVINANANEPVEFPCIGGPDLAAIDSRINNGSNRFQIRRQNSNVLSTEKDDEEKKDGNKDNTGEEKNDLDKTFFEEAESYEEKINKLLVDELDIRATSLKTKDDSHILVTFCLETHRVEDVLLKLQENGIGNSPSETSISVIPSSVHFEVPLVDASNPR